jgi:hypothetical protein
MIMSVIIVTYCNMAQSALHVKIKLEIHQHEHKRGVVLYDVASKAPQGTHL